MSLQNIKCHYANRVHREPVTLTKRKPQSRYFLIDSYLYPKYVDCSPLLFLWKHTVVLAVASLPFPSTNNALG